MASNLLYGLGEPSRCHGPERTLHRSCAAAQSQHWCEKVTLVCLRSGKGHPGTYRCNSWMDMTRSLILGP